MTKTSAFFASFIEGYGTMDAIAGLAFGIVVIDVIRRMGVEQDDAVAADVLGASHATGVDIDPKAEDIARQNAAINQIFADRFTALTGDVIGDTAMMEKLEAHYDVVLANIVADVIIPLAPVVPHFLGEDSVFICSGILNTRLSEVISALEAAGLQVLSTEQQEDWCRVTAVLAG